MSTVLNTLTARASSAMTKPGAAMRKAIATAHAAATYAAIKERTGVMPKGLSRAERNDLKARVAEQLKYYDAFAERAPDKSEAQVAANAQMYAGAVRGTWYGVRYPSLTQVPGDGQTSCLTNCKCGISEKDDGLYWELSAAENCDDCEAMAAGSPYDATKALKAQTDQERAMFAKMGGGKGPGKGYDKSKSTLTKDKAKAGGGGSGGAGAAADGSTSPDGHSKAANDAHQKMMDAEAEIERQKEPLRDARRKIMDEKAALYEQRETLAGESMDTMLDGTAEEKAAVQKKLDALDKQIDAKQAESDALLKETLAVDQKVAHGILKVDNPATLDSRFDNDMSQAERQQVHDAADMVRQYTSTPGLNDHPIRYSMQDGVRAHAVNYGDDMRLSGEVNLGRNDGASVIAHEIGHHIEFRNPEAKARAAAFLARRTQGEHEQKMSAVTGNPSYSDNEVTKVDKFSHPYMGKQYASGDTEIISMGVEQLVTDPIGFAKSDPDYFQFMYDTLRGG